MMTNNFEWPPEGKEIVVSLRESNGEHGLYPCIYMGLGIFKFIQNGEQYACEIQQEKITGEVIEKGVPKIKEKLGIPPTIYLIGKPIIGWWVPKRGTDNTKGLLNLLKKGDSK